MSFCCLLHLSSQGSDKHVQMQGLSKAVIACIGVEIGLSTMYVRNDFMHICLVIYRPTYSKTYQNLMNSLNLGLHYLL